MYIHLEILDGSLLQNKLYKEFIQDFDLRKKIIEDYCHLHKPEVECNIVRLTDVAGPSGSDPTIQAILVTEETSKSVPIINEMRIKGGLDPLASETISLIESDEELKKIKDDFKVSSTTIRKYLYEQQNK